MALDRAKARANAEKFLRANRVQEAIRELQKLAEDNPHDIQTLNQIGNLYLRVGNKEAAVPMFLKVAELYNKNGFATKAVASLKIATREAPENLAAWEMLAALSEQQGFAREARQAYDQVAQLVAKSGNLETAIRIQRKIMDLEPENLKVRIQLGDNLVKLGKTDEGVKEYLRSATQLMSQGLVKEATRLYERALQLGPDNLRVLEGLVKTYMARQEHEAAIKILDGLLEKHPTSEALLLLKIEVLSDLKQVAQAEQVCLRLYQAHPQSTTARSRLIRLLLIQQKHDEAAEMLGNWAKECEAAKLPEAETLFEEILRFSPEHLPSLEGMATVFRRSSNNQRLSGVLTKLASTAEAGGKFGQARSALQELANIEPDNAVHKEKLKALEANMGLRFKAAAPPAPAPKAPPPPPPTEEIPIEVESTGEVEIEIGMDDLNPKEESPASEPEEEREAQMEVEVTSPMAKQVMAPPSPPPASPVARAVERPPAVEAAPPAARPAMDARDAEVIRDQLTEAEVFLKYGLTEKAIAELQAVLKKVPDHVHAHQKLIAIYKKQKKPEKAVRQITRLAKVFRDLGEKETCENLIEEARALDPNSAELQEFLEKAAPAPVPERKPEAKVPEARPPAAEKPSAPTQPELERFVGARAKAARTPELDLGLLVPVPESKRAAKAEGPDLVVSLDEAASARGEATPVLEEPVLEPVQPGAVSPAEAGTARAPAGLEGELAEQMEEAEFYLSQELYGEAQRAVQVMEARWPANTGVHSIRQRLNMALGVASAPAPQSLRVSGLEEIELAEPPEEPHEEAALDLGVETSSPLEVVLPEEPALVVESTGEGVIMSEIQPEQAEKPEMEAEQAQEEEPQVGFDLAGESTGEQMPVEDFVADAIPFKEEASFKSQSEAAKAPGATDELFEKPAQPPATSFLSPESLLAGLPEIKRTKPKAAALPDLSDLLGPLREKPAKAPAAGKIHAEPVEEPKGPAKLRLSLKELLPDEVVEKEQDVLKEEAKEDTKDEYYDLATELGAALEGLQSQEESLFEEEGKSPEEMSFEEVFEEFKKGVERKVSEEDASTHYNLGIAYKEMELLDESIGEFQVAARSPQYFVECCSMLGICFRQKGLAELAEKWYRKGIESPGFSDEAYIGLKYDLAETLVEEGHQDQAAKLYKEVYAVNANYRDIKDKVKNLKK